MKLYVGPEIRVPRIEEVEDAFHFGYNEWVSADRTFFIFNFVDVDFPDGYCQIQVLKKSPYPQYSFFHVGPRETRIPDEIILEDFLPVIRECVRLAQTILN